MTSQAAAGSEEIIEPELAICDPHHHLWHMTAAAADTLSHVPITEYLLPEFLRDVGAGHNIVSTVYMQAGAFLRAGVSPDLAPIGETDEQDRCAQFLRQLDPAWPPADFHDEVTADV